MKKRSFVWPVLGLAVSILFILTLFPLTASATQTMDVLISGVVTLDGQSLSPQDDAVVSAMISGVSGEWSKVVTFTPGVSRYVQLLVPANTGSGAANGGQKGDIIHLKVTINGSTYMDPVTLTWVQASQFWHSVNVTSSALSNLEITTSALSAGTVGVDYTQDVEASGGTPPYAWSWINGGVNGLSISPTTGYISGMPTGSGTFSVKVTVKDSMQVSASRDFALVIHISPDDLIVTTSELHRWANEVFDNATPDWVIPPPGWIVNEPYSDNLSASGGTGPYHWSASGLPHGLTLADNGTLSGTPDVVGLFDNILVSVVDSAVPPHSNSKILVLKIYERGDANGKDGVGSGDIAYDEKVILKTLPPTAGSDANKDGKNDVADITEIEKIIFGF